MNPILTLTQFTPSDVEKITGLLAVTQRDWRHRGFIKKADGHARFDLFDLSAFLAMKLLSERGVGPQSTHDISPYLAVGIAYFALCWCDSYEGDADKVLLWSKNVPPHLRVKSRDEMREDLVKKLSGRDNAEHEIETVMDQYHPDDVGSWIWGAKADWLSRRILREKGLNFRPARFFVWWADNSHVFTEQIDAAFTSFVSSDPQVSGPVIVLDLQALGTLIGERSAKPFVHVEIEVDRETGEVKPPEPIAGDIAGGGPS